MKITFEKKNIKCDSINCNKLSEAKLDVGSYKGYLFFCKKCLKQLQSLLKKDSQKNEQ